MARAIAVGGIAIFLHAVENLVFDLRISHGIGQVRLYESRRNARYAQLVPGFHAQYLRDGAHGILCAGAVDENVELGIAVNRQSDKMGQVLASFDCPKCYVRACWYRQSANSRMGGGNT